MLILRWMTAAEIERGTSTPVGYNTIKDGELSWLSIL